MNGSVALIMKTLYRVPNCVRRISIYSSLYIENFTQTSDLPPNTTGREDFPRIPALPLDVIRILLEDFKLGGGKQVR